MEADRLERDLGEGTGLWEESGCGKGL